jgi:hypothetical protein
MTIVCWLKILEVVIVSAFVHGILSLDTTDENIQRKADLRSKQGNP